VHQTHGRPNLLLVTVDTQRADHTDLYGYRLPTTPRLAAVGAAGVTCDAAYTVTPTTGPSHATLLTSRWPNQHGILKNGFTLRPDETMLAEILAGAGYQTAAVVSSYVLARTFGWDQGFGVYDDDFAKKEASYRLERWEGLEVDSPAFDRRAEFTTARAIARLEAAARVDAPWFLWVHYYDPHAPYDPPRLSPDLPAPRDATGQLPRAIAAYDQEIRYTDDEVAKVLDAQDRLFGADRTLVVVATDHGEGLQQHGWMAHGANLYEEQVHTVLAFRWPGHVPAGRRIAEPVGLVDVVPTVATLLGVPLPPGRCEGLDLSAAILRGVAPPADRPLYFQRRLYKEGDKEGLPVLGDVHAIRAGTWKYIEAAAGPRELYDLAADPGETENVYAREPARAAALAAALAAWRTAVPPPPAAQEVSPDAAARLKALGYVQ
jgi:arylsulfatase A-like enzyme